MNIYYSHCVEIATCEFDEKMKWRLVTRLLLTIKSS